MRFVISELSIGENGYDRLTYNAETSAAQFFKATYDGGIMPPNESHRVLVNVFLSGADSADRCVLRQQRRRQSASKAGTPMPMPMYLTIETVRNVIQ